MLDVVQELLCVLSYDGTIVWAGPAWQRQMGLDPEALPDQVLCDLAHPDDRRRLALELIVLRERGSITSGFECRMLAADGDTRWIGWTGGQGPDGLMLSGRDVSDRRSAGNGGREELVASALDAIVSIDADDLIVEFNPSAEHIFGYRREDVLGSTLTDLIVPHAQREAHRSGVRRVAQGGAFKLLGKRLELNAVRAGGEEFPAELTITQSSRDPFRVTAFVRDLTDRVELEGRLRDLSELDPLTGLMNRRRFEHRLAACLNDPDSRGGALLLLDLDHFKFVNDSFGHAAGDDLIRAIASVLGDRVREQDTLARLGGDEFAVLLPGSDAEEATEVARRLTNGIEAARPTGLQIGASVGATCFPSDATISAGDLLVSADIALYEAKNHGRGRVEFFAGQPGTSLTWVQRVRAALDESRFVLHSQPIFALDTGERVQEELLVRMLDEDGEVLPPAQFLPTAEAFGLIGEIDRWVLTRGLQIAATGRFVHINLSGRSVGSASWLEHLTATLESTGADPGNLVFELTETAAVSNMIEAQDFAEQLQRLGCGLALDDFGTGFGSFTYLRSLPADYLKIDMAFVRNLAANEADLRVVKAVVGVAARFGQRTVAEGVEDEVALEMLRDAGVDYAQGYHLGRPAHIEV